MKKIYNHGGSLVVALSPTYCRDLDVRRGDWVEVQIIELPHENKIIPTIIIQKCQAISVK